MFYGFAALFLVYYLVVSRPSRLVSMLRRDAGLRSASMKIYVGGLPGNTSMNDLTTLLGGRQGYSSIRLYEIKNSAWGMACYSVITPKSAAARHRLLIKLRGQPLVVRPYVERSGVSRQKPDRRCYVERPVCEGIFS